MIRDVLRTAGLRGVEADISSDTKRAASAFVRAEFGRAENEAAIASRAEDKIASRDSLLPIDAPVRARPLTLVG